MMLSTGARRARKIIDEHDSVSSRLLADELCVTRHYAAKMLRELVRAGIVDVRPAEGGTYEWSRR